MAEEQNLAAERFIQELDASDRKRYMDQEKQLQDNLLSSQQRESLLEEATISRYLIRGRSPSPSRGGAGGGVRPQSSREDLLKLQQVQQRGSRDALLPAAAIVDVPDNFRTYQG